MVNSYFLRYLIHKNNDTIDGLASALNISRCALSSKINNKTEFKFNEVIFISRRYKLTIRQVEVAFLEGGKNENFS